MEITVNGETISKEICNQEIQNVWRQNRELTEDQIKEQAIQNIVDWTLIRQNAMKTITTVSSQQVDNAFKELVASHGGEDQFYKQFNITKKDDDKVKNDLKTNLQVSSFLTDLTKDIPAPDESKIESYYNEHPKEFTDPEKVHAAHIVRQANPQNPAPVYQEMKKIRADLLNKGDFQALANQHSSCDDNGGDLGVFAPGQMVEEFDTVIFSMEPGEISPVFMTQFGYHIATVYEKFPASVKPLDSCRNEIIDKLHTDLKDDHIAEWVDEQKKNADINVTE